MIRRLLAPFLVLVLLLVLVTGAVADPATVAVNRVLRLGPLPLALPAFHDADTHGVTLAELAKAPTLDVPALRPGDGQDVPAPGGDRDWRAIGTPLELRGADTPREVWLAVYLNSDRWHEATLALDLPDSLHLQAWLEGESVSFAQDEEDGRRAELDLPSGDHLLVVRVVAPVAPDATWSLAPALTLADDVPAKALATTTDSRRPADIDLVLDAPRVQQAVISPDGALIALRLTARPAGGDAEHWLEIRAADSGDLVTTWRAGEARHLAWSPDGERLSFTLKDDDTTDLWLYDVANGATTRLLRGVADMDGYRWAPSGEFVVYAVQVKPEKDERKVKRVRNPADRQPWYRDRSFLVQGPPSRPA